MRDNSTNASNFTSFVFNESHYYREPPAPAGGGSTENRIIFWHTASKAFTKAIEERKIKGTIKKEKQEVGKLSFTTSTVILTDSATRI